MAKSAEQRARDLVTSSAPASADPEVVEALAREITVAAAAGQTSPAVIRAITRKLGIEQAPTREGRTPKQAAVEASPPEGGIPVDAYLHRDEAFAHFSLPGVGADNIDIEIVSRPVGSVLTVKADRPPRTPAAEGADVLPLVINELPTGPATRQVRFNLPVDADNVSGYLLDGVLTVAMPVARRSAGAASTTVREFEVVDPLAALEESVEVGAESLAKTKAQTAKTSGESD